MRPSDQPDPSPRLSRIPPTPPGAPPTTGELGGPSPLGGNPRPRLFGFGKFVAITLISIVGAIWLAGPASVLPALAVGFVVSVAGSRALFIARVFMIALIATLMAALGGVFLVHRGELLSVLLRAVVIWLAITPAVTTMVFWMWAREFNRRRASA